MALKILEQEEKIHELQAKVAEMQQFAQQSCTSISEEEAARRFQAVLRSKSPHVSRRSKSPFNTALL